MASDVIHIICKILMRKTRKKTNVQQYPKFSTQIWKCTPPVQNCVKFNLSDRILHLISLLEETTLLQCNPLNPKSDLHLISPYNITPESNIKVMRIKEMVTREGTFWLANKFSLSAP